MEHTEHTGASPCVLNALRKKGMVVERIKKIAWMSIGYIALFTCISLVVSLLKHEPFKFDIWMDLIGAILCAIATELVPNPRNKLK